MSGICPDGDVLTVTLSTSGVGCWEVGGDGTSSWSRMCNPTIIRTPLPLDLWLIQSRQDKVEEGVGDKAGQGPAVPLICQIERGMCTSIVNMHK